MGSECKRALGTFQGEDNALKLDCGDDASPG